MNEVFQAAEDIVVFADEATSTNRKEMMGVYVAYFSEKAKCFKLDFIRLFSVFSTKAEILLDKIKEVFTERNIDLPKTRFTCFDGTNAVSGTKTGLQRRSQGEALHSIYVNCRCHRFALCFTHLLKGEFPWLQKIDQLLLGLWKILHYCSKNRHVLAELQKPYGVKTLQMVLHVRCRERYSIILEALDDLVSENQNAEWIQYRSTLLEGKTFIEICFLEDVLSITNVL